MALNFESNKLLEEEEEQQDARSEPPLSRTIHEANSAQWKQIPLDRQAPVGGTAGNHSNLSIPRPLQWKQVRNIMRQVLNTYMEESPTTERDIDINESSGYDNSVLKRALRFWFSHDLDCYFGSILCCLALLILSVSLSIQERKNDGKSEQSLASLKIYTSQITASVILLTGSLLSVWWLHRRRLTSRRGAETKKRIVVGSFLAVLDSALENDSETSIPPSVENVVEVSGTSLTDIYPVYRISEDGDGNWIKLPSLLLVEGDFIALQLGDTAPADCELVTGSKVGLASSSSSSLKMMTSPNFKTMGGSQHKSQRDPVVVKADERVEPSHRMKFENRTNIQVCDNLFPPGKSKVPENSRKLLHLSNHSKVFQLLETPIAKFLRKKSEPRKTPQIHRKIETIRIALYFMSVITVFVSYAALSTRHSVERTSLPLVLSLPLLAALGTLPITAPVMLILMEVLGTSRILVVVHPYASNVKQIDSKVNLFLNYFWKGIMSRLELANACIRKVLESSLMDFPIASSFLFEKLGVVTALSLIDDELACDPVSTPQRLLIPTSNGLKLLDLFPKYEEDSDDESSDDENKMTHRRRARSIASSHDSDSDWGDEPPDIHRHGSSSRLQNLRAVKFRRWYKKKNLSTRKLEPPKPTEVEFEDPNWWKYLPSLKCIGLGSLLVDNKICDFVTSSQKSPYKATGDGHMKGNYCYIPGAAENSLIRHVKQYYDRTHLRLLSKCIGFTTDPNSSGPQGDISPFEELRRIRIIATRLLHHRMKLDRHQISLEESRSWGSLRPDSTSVIIKDNRSHAYQLLTVGDARVVTDLCSECWQGEIITPLTIKDRKMILENNNAWSLADLDVTAFSYAPIPYSSGEKFAVQRSGKQHLKSANRPMTHLIDNRMSGEVAATLNKDSGADDWSLIKNQIFLGLLGSCVSPRRDVASLIEDCTNAGVRFVYFSPRNMRRTKELASQMGIDVAWNCAISLRPLDEGEETDEHRMTSDYADWDVNARLPHGVENVKRHLKDVDNVPLLVSLFTDVNKKNTCEMVNVFQEYNDTVLSLGLSHLSQNDDTFNSSDLSFGNDVLFESIPITQMEGEPSESREQFKSSLHRKELLFISKVASHSCVFNLSLGQSGLINVAEIIEEGRAALSSGTTAGNFMIYAGVAITFTILFCTVSASTMIPIIPATGIALYIQLLVPVIAISMAFSKSDETTMTIVPPKNDQSITFAAGECKRIIFHFIFRSAIPVGASHLIFLISFGTLLLDTDPDTFENLCQMDESSSNWTDVIRCSKLSTYVGDASMSSGLLMLAELSLCVIAQSASFLLGNSPIIGSDIMEKNRVWLMTSLCCVAVVFISLHFTLYVGTLQVMPWYFFLLAFVFPPLSVVSCEIVKRKDKRFEERAEMLRRLQFETRLGMWSPK